jgi:two-component system cell cycle sensor histidine kinase/response regulator CckA
MGDAGMLEDLEEGPEFYRALFEVNTAIKLLIDPSDGQIVDANPAAAEFYGWSLDELRTMRIGQINILTAEEIRRELLRAQTASAPTPFHFRHRTARGEIRDVEVHSGPVAIRGKPRLLSIIHDVTERNQLEEKLRRAQRLDAIGRLAAGVAHDFNNLLAISLASVELAERKIAADHPALAHLADVKRTVRLGAELTTKMLAFARQGELAPARIDLGEMIAGTAELLRNVLGSNISVTTEISPNLPGLRIDPSQLELAFINIALNARDAMPDGGDLVIRARALPDGRVWIELEDNGHGMDAPTQTRAFEPFFTTKPHGSGSGLGLATVYGLISQSEGELSLDSAPGKGTRVRILLPPYDRVEVLPPAAASQRTAKHILLVDDRDDVRAALADALVDAGLTVHVAEGARDAFAKLETLGGAVDVVLSDVAMPERSGVELAGDIRARWPDLPVVLMSGHRHPPTTAAITGWLAKPFTIDDVLAVLNRVLA